MRTFRDIRSRKDLMEFARSRGCKQFQKWVAVQEAEMERLYREAMADRSFDDDSWMDANAEAERAEEIVNLADEISWEIWKVV